MANDETKDPTITDIQEKFRLRTAKNIGKTPGPSSSTEEPEATNPPGDKISPEKGTQAAIARETIRRAWGGIQSMNHQKAVQSAVYRLLQTSSLPKNTRWNDSEIRVNSIISQAVVFSQSEDFFRTQLPFLYSIMGDDVLTPGWCGPAFHFLCALTALNTYILWVLQGGQHK